jgi:amidase
MSISAIDWARKKRVATTRSHASQLGSLLAVAAFYWISRVFREEAHGLVENTEQGLAMTARDTARGELLRTRLWNRVRAFMARRDLWITPTSAVPPFPIDQPQALEVNGQPLGRSMQRSYLTYAFSVLGLPAISIPCGFTRGGLPVGLQIVGKPRGEAAVLRGAAAFEAAHPWAHRIPPSVERV